MCLAAGGLALSFCAVASFAWSAGFDPATSNPVTANESPEQVELLKQAREAQERNAAASAPSFKDRVENWFRAHRPFASSTDQVTTNETTAQKNLIKQANDSTDKEKNKTEGKSSLKDTLEKGLKARRPEEFSFVRRVVLLVDTGRLPRSVVESTFLWARAKEDYPFQYFQMGLTLRAKKLGISM
jgi:hypothetical protein